MSETKTYKIEFELETSEPFILDDCIIAYTKEQAVIEHKRIYPDSIIIRVIES